MKFMRDGEIIEIKLGTYECFCGRKDGSHTKTCKAINEKLQREVAQAAGLEGK